MSTGNFFCKHALHYYVIGEGWNDVDYRNFYEGFPTMMETEFQGTRDGCSPDEIWKPRMPWEGTLLGSAAYPVDFDLPYTHTKVDLAIRIYIYANSGRYHGTNLDWDLGFTFCDYYGWRTDFLSDYRSVKDMVSDIISAIFEDLEYHEDEKETPAKERALARHMRDVLVEYGNKADNFCKKACQQVLRESVRHSDGSVEYSECFM